jgi:hypothetical protein
MAPPRKPATSVITLRAKQSIALPPSILGYQNLLTPETFDPEKPKLSANCHFTPQGLKALEESIATKVYSEAALAKIRADCAENGIKGELAIKEAGAWLEGVLKEPREKGPQLPFLKVGNNLHYMMTDRESGERVQKTREMSFWDARNRKLNGRKLRLGMDSVIEAVVYPNLYYSKLIGLIQPSLKLLGVRVLELKQFERGSAAPAESSDEAISEVLGRDLHADDLAAYMDTGIDDDEDDGDEGGATPPKEDQSPADRAKGMF